MGILLLQDKRIKIVTLFLGAATFIVISRLFFWQIIKGKELSGYARAQVVAREDIVARRGTIRSSDGATLAASKTSWLLWADPTKLNKSTTKVARFLALATVREELERRGRYATDSATLDNERFVDQEEERLKRLLARDVRWVTLSEKVSDSAKREIESLGIEGIGFTLTEDRLYPEATMAAHLLGFVGKDETGTVGNFGLEGYYDVTLSGKSGVIREERDVRGNPIPFGNFSEIAAQSGLNLVTFIDRTVQYFVEKKLTEGIEKYGAKAGNITVMRPTGEVVAMASFPSYDPARYSESDENVFKNPVVADSFEPGSVFKVIVMAGALDSGVVEPDTKCDKCSGPVRIDKYQIHTWDDKYFPDSTMKEVIVHSDNTGMVFVGKRLGDERMVDYLNRFGIGRLTGVDLQEEATPTIRSRDEWGFIDTATASFGQGVAITPMQLVRAVAAIANGGILPVPRVVEKIESESWQEEIPRKDEGRVIKRDTVAKITDMMVEAVRAGEAKWAAPKGFKIAGKTGTAQIPIAGHYDPEKTIASFIGFAPVDNPKFVMLVSLREPTSSPFGSETAAPLWFSIAKDLFPYFGVTPSQ